MTFEQLYGEQLTIELASRDTTELFTTVRRKAAINEAVGAFIRLTDCVKRVGTISIVDGTATYGVEIELPDYLRLYGDPSIRIEKTGVDDRYIQGQDFKRRDTEELDFDEPGWRAVSAGTPKHWYLEDLEDGATSLGLYPPPDVGASETWTLRVPYVALPKDMTADGEKPFTIDNITKSRLSVYHQGLVHYAAARLESLRKNYSAVQRQMSLFNGYVAMYLQDERTEGSDQITLERDYYSESVRRPLAVDPRRFP